MTVKQLYPVPSNLPASVEWRLISDQVMGGVSLGHMQDSGSVVNMQGQVSLDNNGGFVQIQTLLPKSLDTQNYHGIVIEVFSASPVNLQLLVKSSQLWMPWQSYRAQIEARPEWQTYHIPFSAFQPYKTQTPLNVKRVTKFAVLAGGKAMSIDVSVRKFGLYQ